MDKYQELIKDLESEYNYLNGKVAEYFEVSAELSGKCDRYSEQTMKYVKAKDERMADNCRDKYDKVKALFNRNYDYYLAYKDSARAINRLLNKAKEENNNGKNV